MLFKKKKEKMVESELALESILRLIKKSNSKNHAISKQLNEVRDLIKQQNIRVMRERNAIAINKSELDVYSLSYYSQHGEDGALLSILDSIGLNGGVSYELGAGDNGGCTGTLSLLRDFKSVFIEQDDALITSLKNKFAFGENEIFCNKITTENVDSLISEAPDVLSCDLDSIDYWILNAMSARPRVVIAEYNASLGPDFCVTVPENYPHLNINPEMKVGQFYGCSLSALNNLFESRSMSLVYCDISGTNAFFVDDIYKDFFTKLSPDQAYRESNNSRLASSRGYNSDKIISSFYWQML